MPKRAYDTQANLRRREASHPLSLAAFERFFRDYTTPALGKPTVRIRALLAVCALARSIWTCRTTPIAWRGAWKRWRGKPGRSSTNCRCQHDDHFRGQIPADTLVKVEVSTKVDSAARYRHYGLRPTECCCAQSWAGCESRVRAVGQVVAAHVSGAETTLGRSAEFHSPLSLILSPRGSF